MGATIRTIILPICVLVGAVLAIWSEKASRRRVHLVAKPLTTILIIAVAALAAEPVPPVYKTLILAGLVFSLLGDVALMFPDKLFIAGLVAFLAAQVLYIFAFRPAVGQPVPFLTFLPFILFGLLMFFLLAPGLGPLKLPVLVYIGAITTMAGFAAVRYVHLGGTRPLLAFAGAVLFLISDSVLAYDRFGKKFALARALVLATYFPAQLLIALSI
ncbi:MAG: lysoplasmalogenase [Candidatus Aminicenantes bacterium]|nr:MAG: lysoplasmalogenase [Candidatus Aminicenantes bacterium]RPJ03332.1 MAG: lysoplasmalogenase [Candidatus Aminicenantes bacterium]